MSSQIKAESARRRTFAVISHPDAGKSTITEAIALHGQAIAAAGAVHGKGSRKGVVSDWMSMEQDRGISITSAALQFEYRDCVVNLLDTPGHADFSEDTYRVLTAVDAAVMLLDAAKGLEPQTLKLFEVCRARRIPVITFINKWDRPAKDALELLEEIEERIGIKPTPVTWPVGIGGEFRGVVERIAIGERSEPVQERSGERSEPVQKRSDGSKAPGMVRYERSPAASSSPSPRSWKPTTPRPGSARTSPARSRSPSCSPRSRPTSTRRPSRPARPRPRSSAPPWSTSASGSCSTCWSTSRPPRSPARTSAANPATWRPASPASSSSPRPT
ncbi:hypothetical protein GCM10029992_09800 [Glycomyces albus]